MNAMEAITSDAKAKHMDVNEIHRSGAPEVARKDLNPSFASLKNPYLELPLRRTLRL